MEIINNRYQLHERLGEGGMGAVYRATDRLTGRSLALKRVLLDPQHLNFSTKSVDAELHMALAAEFQVLAALRHPNIISVLDYGFDEKRQPYFTMDLLEHAPTIIEAGAEQPLRAKVQMIIQVLQALTYLHRRGILHRDIKPGNLLVDGDAVRVVDFGLAVDIGEADEFQGTVAYMAPEVLQGEVALAASDLFAVGMVAFELLVGRYPFNLDAPWVELVTAIVSYPLRFDEVPRVPGDDPAALERVVARLLERKPDRRYQSAEAVIHDLCAALDTPPPVETVAIRESQLQAPAFVGRRRELDYLTQSLHAAMAGSGSVWLVGGESGVGKTRLLDELRVRALVQGVRVLRGHGVEDGDQPYQLWREPLRHLMLSTPVDDIEAGILKPIVPDIERLLGRPVPEAPPISPIDVLRRLVATIVELFRRQHGPLLVLLEDLQWAAESLEPLQLLARAVPGLPLLVVADFRDDERPDLPNLVPEAHLIILERLAEYDIRALMQAMLGTASSDLVTLLQRETEGNVFFLVETLRTLAEDLGSLERIATEELPATVFASGVQAVLQRRVERVPRRFRITLEVAAVAGRQLDMAVLATAAGDEDLDLFLTACANAAVLEMRDGRWHFTHDQLRHYLLESLGDTAPYHRRIAQAIEMLYDPDERAAALSRHWEAAGEPERALEATLRAGDRAFRFGAAPEAVAHYRRALSLRPHNDGVVRKLARAQSMAGQVAAARDQLGRLLARTTDPRTRAAIMSELVDNLIVLGDVGEAAQLAAQALTLYDALGDDAGKANALGALAEVYRHRGEYLKAYQSCQQALELMGPGEHTRLWLTMTRVLISLGEYAEAQDYLRQALDVAHARHNRALEANCYNELGIIAAQQDDHEASRRYYQQSYELNEELGLPMTMATAATNLGIAHKNLGQLDEALYWYQRAVAIFSETGNRTGEMANMVNLATLFRLLHFYDSALESLQVALGLATEIEATWAYWHILLELAQIHRSKGELFQAIELGSVIIYNGGAERHVADEARAMLAALKPYMEPNAYAAAVVGGQDLDPEALFANLMGVNEDQW